MQERNRPWEFIAVAMFALIFAVCDLAVAPAMSAISPHDAAAVFVYADFGAIAAQGCLLAIWSVVGPTSAWKRRLSVIAIGLFWLIAWAAGYSASTSYDSLLGPRNEAWLGCAVPLICVAAEIPLWIARIFFRWRLERIDSDFSLSNGYLSLAEMMMFTGIVALSFGSARLANLQGEFIPFWAGLTVAAASAGGLSLLAILPVLWLMLGTRNVRWGLAGVSGYATGAILVLLAVIPMAMRVEFSRVLFSLPPTIVGFVAALAIPLVVLRLLGYRLAWGCQLISIQDPQGCEQVSVDIHPSLKDSKPIEKCS